MFGFSDFVCLMICWFVLGLVFEVGVDSVSMEFGILGGVFLLGGFVFEIGALVMLLLGLRGDDFGFCNFCLWV